MSSSDLVAALSPVVDALEQLASPYCVGGSVASSVFGVPRATLDVDILTDVRIDQVEAFVSLLSKDYYVDADMMRDAIRRRASFNMIHLETMLKIDIFIVRARPFDRMAITRPCARFIDEGPGARSYAFHSPEDIILNKLEWYRMGGEISDRQWTDILGVMKVQVSALDVGYLRIWAADLGVADLLERALVDAGIGTATGR